MFFLGQVHYLEVNVEMQLFSIPRVPLVMVLQIRWLEKETSRALSHGIEAERYCNWHILINEINQAPIIQLSWILKRDVLTSSSLCPPVDVNSVFPLFFCLFVLPLISFLYVSSPFSLSFVLSRSPPPVIFPALIFILRLVPPVLSFIAVLL